MDAYFKVNLLDARIEGLLKEIETAKETYHNEGNYIQLRIINAPIQLYGNKEIINQSRANNWEEGDFELQVISNKVFEIMNFADQNSFRREIIISLPTKQAFQIIRHQFIYFNSSNCVVSINGLTDEPVDEDQSESSAFIYHLETTYGMNPDQVIEKIKEVRNEQREAAAIAKKSKPKSLRRNRTT